MAIHTHRAGGSRSQAICNAVEAIALCPILSREPWAGPLELAEML